MSDSPGETVPAPRVAAIVGPTGVGKTAVSLEVAEELDAEIVSVDSMQIYRGMDIGTDKLPEAERRGILHHLIDVFDPSHEVTVAEYQELGRAAIADIAGRGKLPLLVGGSGLYFRAIVDDLIFPPRSPEVRAALEDEVDEVGPRVLHERLAELDPVAALRIQPQNARRTIRALEVIAITGRPFSENATWDDFTSLYDLIVVGLQRPRMELFDLIEARVEDHLERGLIEEARKLEAAGLARTARQALGYRQILDAPADTSRDGLHRAISSATKRFARRQESWFSGDPRVRWIDHSREVVGEVCTHLSKGA